jgi:hypothetical protein
MVMHFMIFDIETNHMTYQGFDPKEMRARLACDNAFHVRSFMTVREGKPWN